MVAGPEVMHQVVPMLEASFHLCPVKGIEEVVSASLPKADPEGVVEVPDLELKAPVEPLQFVPNIRSGSFADIGPRRYMEDEHIRIDDLSGHLGSLLMCPEPNAFYGVFDGHGGPDAAAYMKMHGDIDQQPTITTIFSNNQLTVTLTTTTTQPKRILLK